MDRAIDAEWERLPEVAVMFTVAVEGAVPAAAVRLVLCAVPGIRESEDGFALTPGGRPLRFTATVPEKPFAGTAFTFTTCPAPPATKPTAVGETVSEKSGAGVGGIAAAWMVRAIDAQWERPPEVAVMFTVAVDDAALVAAVRVVLLAVPGVRESEDGLALTPDGRPLRLTATAPEKPFAGTAFTLTT